MDEMELILGVDSDLQMRRYHCLKGYYINNHLQQFAHLHSR
jgi:hypothetical protein